MSTRSQVFMKNSGTYLYKHSDGYNLPLDVMRALRQKLRWNDEEYLTRVIFETMLEKQYSKETGFGIGTIQHFDIEWLVIVDVDTQTIQVKQGYGNLEEIWNGTFDQFCTADTKAPILEIEESK